MQHVIAADKTKLYVKDWGTGRPVILIHGWPLSADSWDSQAMALAEAGFRAIAYDRRGFGRSTQPWNGYDYDTLADDLAAVIEQTGAKEAAVIGFSMGGGEVARYMSRHAGKGVVQAGLIASILPFRLKTQNNPTGTDQAAFDQTAQALRDDRPQFLTGFFNKFFGVDGEQQSTSPRSTNPPLTNPPLTGLQSTTGNQRQVSAETLLWAHGLALQAGLPATLACAKSFSSTDFRDELAAFQVPTLLIHGTHDKVVAIDASSRLAAKAISQARLIEYPGAPHGLFVTDKDRLTSDLLDFLRR